MKARDNPFTASRIHAIRYRLQGDTWDELMARLAVLHYRAAIVGPKGSGKTTFLHDLVPRLNALGFTPRLLRLTCETPRFEKPVLRAFCQDLTGRDVVLLDGAEQLNWLRWRSFSFQTRRAAGLIITTHSKGRLPTLRECATSAVLLWELLDELLKVHEGESSFLLRPFGKLGKGETERMSGAVSELFQRHGGNVRDALHELYDRCAEM